MRGFRIVSIIALLLWLSSLILTALATPNKQLHEDALFMRQLNEMEGTTEHKRIFIYGSSGLLLGISAEELQLLSGRVVRNLSTTGRGGQIESAIALMSPHIQNGDIVLIGDRSYRESHRVNNSLASHLRRIPKLNSLIPNLRAYFGASSPLRTRYGDLINYPSTNILSTDYDISPVYNSENIDYMKRQVNLVKQSGGCPVLVLVPVLVNQNEREVFENATRQLFSLADSVGLAPHVLHAYSIETDKSLFVDQDHMSRKGRTRWTTSIGKELIERHLCDLGSAPN